MSTATQLLDQAHAIAQIDAVDADAFGARLRDELAAPGTLAAIDATDAALRAALAAIDAFASKAMRVRLDRVLAADTSLGAPFKKVIAATIVGYANLELLRERVASTAARLDPRGAAATADAVVDAARAVLDQRARLQAGVLALARDLATAALPEARRAARDRSTDDAVRLRWSAVRRDLEAVVERPERVAEAPVADRTAALPAVLDEPEETPAPSFGELLELD